MEKAKQSPNSTSPHSSHSPDKNRKTCNFSLSLSARPVISDYLTPSSQRPYRTSCRNPRAANHLHSLKNRRARYSAPLSLYPPLPPASPHAPSPSTQATHPPLSPTNLIPKQPHLAAPHPPIAPTHRTSGKSRSRRAQPWIHTSTLPASLGIKIVCAL